MVADDGRRATPPRPAPTLRGATVLGRDARATSFLLLDCNDDAGIYLSGALAIDQLPI